MHNMIADAMTVLRNAESIGKDGCTLNHAPSMLQSIVKIFKENGYIAGYKVVKDCKGDRIEIELNGMINDCKPIMPRHAIKKDEYMKFEKRYLPASNVGVMIISTSEGIKVHKDVKGRIGGTLIAYVY